MILHRIRLALLPVLLNLLIFLPLSAAEGSLAEAGDGSAKPRLVDLWQPGDPGERMNIRGHVTSTDGTPIAGASIYLRQANGDGAYTEQYSTVIESDARGRYQFGSVVPGQYYSAKHVHLWVTHDDYQSLETEILFKGDPNLEDPETPNAIFLEQASVGGETMLYGRFDIMLAPR